MVNTQRQFNKEKKLSPERVSLLEKIGFEWGKKTVGAAKGDWGKQIDMAYEEFLIPIKQPMYRAVIAGRPPLEPSLSQSRAFWTGTAGICCSLDFTTACQEFKRHHSNENMKMHEIEIMSLSALDLEAYCLKNSIAPEDCYAGKISHSKIIHRFYGQKVLALLWPSNVGSGKKSIVFFPENLRCNQTPNTKLISK